MIPCNNLKRSFDVYQDEFERAAIGVLRSGWYILGKNVHDFEQTFADMNGSKFCIGVDNGLDAIKLGVKALGIGVGDEVIIQSNTYIATFLGVTLNGATPIFAEPNDFYNMDSNGIEKLVSNKTKAILVTHLYGQATNMAKIVSVCQKYNLFLLEDCAQSHFAEYCGKKVGTFGIMGFFSFYPTKNIGAMGDAGAVITSDVMLKDKIQMLRNYGSKEKYIFDIEGENARLDEIQAALLLVRLKHANDILKQKTHIAKRYLSEISNPLITLPKIDKDCTTVWHLFVIRVNERNRFRQFLLEKGIDTDVHYPVPPHLSKCYERFGYKEGSFPIAEAYSKTVVDIPIFFGMTDDEVSKVITAINEYR
jgi:dTDP-4-amino-4,6-dideoxygalactose transaminase